MRHSLDKLFTMLHGLIDGSHPLTPPHPQRLSFPNDKDMVGAVVLIASLVLEHAQFKLRDDEKRHLLFKLAAWCSKRGLNNAEDIGQELWPHLEAIDMAISARREWLSSRAGLGWCIKRHVRWRANMRTLARQTVETPFTVADVAVEGYSLVELTNPHHIWAEGVSAEHCMAWSVNLAALKKRGYPDRDDPLSCLTYVIKQRSGELRLFSLREPTGLPMMTLSYKPKKATSRASNRVPQRSGNRSIPFLIP